MIPGPLDTVNSKSPDFEIRTIASPINVDLAVRYMSWPVLVCHPAAGSANWWCDTDAQLVRPNQILARRKRNTVRRFPVVAGGMAELFGKSASPLFKRGED